jgi:hypothetical protein
VEVSPFCRSNQGNWVHFWRISAESAIVTWENGAGTARQSDETRWSTIRSNVAWRCNPAWFLKFKAVRLRPGDITDHVPSLVIERKFASHVYQQFGRLTLFHPKGP